MIVYFENKISKKKEDVILKAIDIAQRELMSDVDDINIYIQSKRNLYSKYNICGDCMWEDDNDYRIRIDSSIEISELITTVLHEMVHVKQYIYGEDVDNNLPYYDRPHEIEAHKLEIVLKRIFDAEHKY